MIDLRAAYSSRVVVVTGASGYLGGALVGRLRNLGAEVIGISRRAGPADDETVVADVREQAPWCEAAGRATTVFHLAADTRLDYAERHQAEHLESTLRPLQHLADATRTARRTPRIVFASTATVYGFTGVTPTNEDVAPAPQSNYDRHKLAAEQFLESLSRERLIDVVSLRISNVYGPSPGTQTAGRGFLNRAAAVAAAGRNLLAYGGGACVRDFVHVDDVVSAMLMAGADAGEGSRVFNVGSGRGHTIREALDLVAAQAARNGQNVTVRPVDWPAGTHAIERRNFVADVGLIRSSIGWAPTMELTDGIRSLMATTGTY